MGRVFGGIEAGGTKFVCALGTNPDDLVNVTRIPTTTFDETVAQVVGFFREHTRQDELVAIGIASFGPIDPDPLSPTYGHITTTPKRGWQNANIVQRIQSAFPVPIGFDTDVNGAALGERRWGAAQGLDDLLYLTIGTGIGGGGLINGKLMHGLVHPEMGHMRIPHDWQADPYAGRCPFHGDCWEGLASGPAIRERWGESPEDLQSDHPAWILEARYLALAITNLICALSPKRIVLGGGVLQQPTLLPMVRRNVQESLNGYIQNHAILEEIDRFIVPPALGNRAGVLGAIALAEMAVAAAENR